METWLTFLVRLVVVAFVGGCLWFVYDSAGPSSENALRRDWGVAPLPVDGVQAEERSLRMRNFGAIVVSVTFVGLLVVLVEMLKFSHFKVVVDRVQALRGSVRFGADDAVTLGNFYFGMTTIDLSGSSLTGIDLPAFERLPNVIAIRLCDSEIDGGVLKAVGRCRKLRSLDLSGTAVGDNEVAELGVLPRLEALVLNHTKVTTKVLGFLMFHPSLSKIEYDGTGIIREEADAFCDRN